MIRSKLVLLSLLMVCGAVWTPTASAQPRYYPTRGPISPWMNLWQRQPGPFDNYHSYVKPELQLQDQMTQQNKSLMQNAQGLKSLGQQFASSQKEAQVSPTGTNSVFMEFSHYYPTMGGHGVGRSHSMSRGVAPSAGGRSFR
jgi:hypothetical protein